MGNRWLLFVIMVGIIAGCGNRTEDKEGQTAEQPVELTVLQKGANISDTEFQELLAEPVKKALPNVTLQLVREGKEQTLETMVASDSVPDLIFASSRDLFQYLRLQVALDLSGEVKKRNIDLSRFEPVALDAIKVYSSRGELYAIPLYVNFSALFYNKTLFDRFGVAYPPDGLTWEEAIELAKKVTRYEGGVQYLGLTPNGIRNFASGLSAPYVDPATGKALLTTEKWKQAFETYRAITDIPGNRSSKNDKDLFEKDRVLAMFPAFGARLGELEEMERQGNPMNWDVATYPSFSGFPGIAAETDIHLLIVTGSGKHKEQAFQVISVLTNEENQLRATKRGRMSALKDPVMKQQFGAELESVKGKNIAGIFKSSPSLPAPPTLYDQLAQKRIAEAITKYIDGKTDVNTALREADEATNRDIAAEKGQ